MTRPVGVILAGGLSRRFGSDKARATLPDGRTLVEHVEAALSDSCAPIVISVSRAQRDLWPSTMQIVDDVPGLGPIGALATALRRFQCDCLLAACDMPFISPDVLAHIIAQCDGEDALVLEDEDVYPVPGLYRASCLPEVERCITAGDLSMKGLLDRITTRRLARSEWEALDPRGDTLVNINTREDMAVTRG